MDGNRSNGSNFSKFVKIGPDTLKRVKIGEYRGNAGKIHWKYIGFQYFLYFLGGKFKGSGMASSGSRSRLGLILDIRFYFDISGKAKKLHNLKEWIQI